MHVFFCRHVDFYSFMAIEKVIKQKAASGPFSKKNFAYNPNKTLFFLNRKNLNREKRFHILFHYDTARHDKNHIQGTRFVTH